MSLASISAFIIANILDIIIFAKLREIMKNKGLWVRTNVSNILSTGIDTFVFLILAFYQLGDSFNENMTFILSIGLPYWFLKCVVSITNTPFVYWGVKKLKEETPKT